MLGSIYHDQGNRALALDLSKKALVLFEHILSSDSSILAELHYNLGIMYLNTGSLADANHSFEHAVKIYTIILPEEHPDRTAAENGLEKVLQLRQKSTKNS